MCLLSFCSRVHPLHITTCILTYWSLCSPTIYYYFLPPLLHVLAYCSLWYLFLLLLCSATTYYCLVTCLLNTSFYGAVHPSLFINDSLCQHIPLNHPLTYTYYLYCNVYYTSLTLFAIIIHTSLTTNNLYYYHYFHYTVDTLIAFICQDILHFFFHLSLHA